MPTRIRSYSKINLGLAIGPLRSDGFHGLATIYQTLALHDVVTVEGRRSPRSSIALTTNHPRVPVDASNTAWKIVERALAVAGLSAEVRIHIEKRLPVEGGLGGGSANAVAALVALQYELQIEIPALERLQLAENIGSDVPLFLLGGTVLGLGRGEQVYPLPDFPSMPCVLALPGAGISTAQAYRDWDRLHPPAEWTGASAEPHPPAISLTGPQPSDTIGVLSRSIAGAFGGPYSSGVLSHGEDRAETPLLALVRTGIENDFEQVVFPQYPLLGEIKRLLAAENGTEDTAVYAALSGSGSALFGLYRTEKAAAAVLDRLRTRGIECLCTRTLSRDEYWREMRVP